MLLGNDCTYSRTTCKNASKRKISARKLFALLAFSFLALAFVSGDIVMAQSAPRPPVQKPYYGPNEVNEFPPMGVETGGPKLKVNGNLVNPLADENEDVVITLCSGTKTWELLKEYTPWDDVNRFGIYTDLGVGTAQTLIFSGPNSQGYTTTTSVSGSVGLWLLNDTDGNTVYSGGDSYLFSERSLTYGSAANEHQWFMVYDVSAYKGTSATYFFETPTEDFTVVGNFDFLVYIDDDHTSSNFDHNDMILAVTCPEVEECDSVKVANHYTLEFAGVTYDSGAGTSTWNYVLEWDGVPPGLSHFTVELCSLLTNANLVASTPSGASIGPDGSTGLYGIKWDDIQNFPANTPVVYSFTIDQMLPIAETQFAPKAGVNANIATICGPALNCDDPCLNDNTPPQFVNCPADATFQCDAVPSPPNDLTGTDNCDPNPDITYLGQSSAPSACPQSYVLTRRWVITDASGNADTCVQIITVQDNAAPTFDNCPANATVQCNNIPAVASPSATDNCGTATVNYLGEVSTPGACPNSYTLTRKWEAIDECGNADTCTQVITVQDTTPPIFVDCPANVTVQCDNIPTVANPSATDSCGAVTVTYLGEVNTPGACPQSYTLTRSWEAVDACGNADTCTQVITVEDTTAPSFVDCPADVTVQCDNIPAPANPSATDNCGAVTVTYLGEVSTPGACPQSYTLTRKWEAADECGNADTCTQVITVEDTTAPSFVDCPADVTVQCDNIPAPANPSATDNCGAVTVTYLGQVNTPGACPQSYTLTRKWQAADECGNADTCTQVITVEDTTAPSFVDCPADVTVQCDNIPAPANPSATDNCGAVTVTYLGQVSTPGACPQSYTLTRKWEAADECGNADTCTQVITVEDTTAPTFVDCPADVTVECDNIPAPASPSAVDNCDANPVVTYLGQSMNAGNCPYTLTRKWEAIDACGNADTCTQIITVQDTQAPVCENVPADVTVECDNIPGVGTPGAVDNCDPNPSVTYLGQVTTPGACPQAYTITRSWEAKDDCGNADTCSQVITVVDTTAPVFAGCPGNVTVQCDNIPAPGSPSASDNCDPNPVVTYLGETSAPGACPQSYTLTRKWEAIDACGNADTCTQVITVEDTTPPVIGTCPPNATVECDNIPAPGNPGGITDNCDPNPSLVYLGESTVPGACPQSYSLVRKWIAVDACGNESDTCTQTITVVDTTPPTFVDCPADASVSCDNIPTVTDPSAVDNCDNNPTVTFLGEEVVNGSCPYFIIRRWEAKDACGNADTCEQTLTVIDNIPPVIANCPGNITVQCGNVPGPATVTATDNCDNDPTVTYLGETSAPGACPQSYVLTRKWVAHDECGNPSDTCVQLVTVEDTTPPTINNCPSNITVECNAVPGPATVTATDNCDSSPAVTYLGETVTPGGCANSRTIVRKWIAVDDCGNKSDTCRQTINVVDTTPPTFANCPNDTSVQCNNVPGPATGLFAQDNCDSMATVSYLGEVKTPGSCPSQYTLTRRWAAIDDCGNADTCTQVISVSDTTTLSLGADSTKSYGDVCSPISGTFGLRDVNGCGPFQWTVNGQPANPDTTIAFSAGLCTNFNQTWTIAVSDSCGRSDSYKVTITAKVNCPVLAECPSSPIQREVCDPSEPICIPGTGFVCTDPDGNATSTLNGQPYTPGDPICFTPGTFGPYNLVFICADGCSADTCVTTVDVIQGQCPEGCPTITIEKTHNVIQGQFETIEVVMDSMAFGIGGFDLLIEYDPTALSLSEVQPGSFITNCGWEYFTYRVGASGNCGNSACPTGKVRIIAIGETNNGMNHPSCYQANPAQLAVLVFLVTNDRTFECQYVPIRFCWYDCGDNTVSSTDGLQLYISDQVFDYYDGSSWTEITNSSAPFPSRFGANFTCFVDPGNGKPPAEPCIDFYNGGVDIVCADSIDDRGDINMNGVPNEVADAVLLGNYFVFGMPVFTVNPAGQIAASDVNADGVVLSVADLVYLIRVVIGDANPYSKVSIPVNVSYAHSSEGRLTIEDNTQIGAASVIFAGQIEPILLAENMEMLTNFDGANTRVLVWSIEGHNFTGEFLQANAEVISIEMATAEGNPVALNVLPKDFALLQNYPNPFNPRTVISFALPSAGDYSLTIYNVNGQQVASFGGRVESAGNYEVEWEAGTYASGIYFYKLVAGPNVAIKKMILLK